MPETKEQLNNEKNTLKNGKNGGAPEAAEPSVSDSAVTGKPAHNNAATSGSKAAVTANDILKPALKAAYWFIVGFALFAVMFTLIFPYPSMRLYFNLGLKRNTLGMAERVVTRFYDEEASYDSKFADGLYQAVGLSGEFMNRNIENKDVNHKRTVKDAEMVLKYTDILINDNSNLDTFKLMRNRRNGVIDSEMRRVVARAGRPGVYKYETTLLNNRARAHYITGGIDGLATHFTTQMYALRDENGTYRPDVMDGYINTFNELSAVLKLELVEIGYYYVQNKDENNLEYITRLDILPRGHFKMLFNNYTRTELLKSFESSLRDVVSYIDGYTAADDEDLLRRAYWALSVSELAHTVRVITEIFYRNEPASPAIQSLHSDWSTLDGITEDGIFYHLSDWYWNLDPVIGPHGPLYDYITNII